MVSSQGSDQDDSIAIMKPSPTSRYADLLRKYLLSTENSLPSGLRAENAVPLFPPGSMAKRIKLHEGIVAACKNDHATKAEKSKILKRAARFFAEAIACADTLQKNPAVRELVKSVETLSRHALELAALRKELQQALKEKNAAFLILQKNQAHNTQLLKKSESLQIQLRRLSRKLLTAQEDERLEISRDLHDVIAQTLAGINIKLSTLKQQSSSNSKGLLRNISSTQRLVEKSVHIVHQFACELRPAVIDDLGLISALQAMLKKFSASTQIHTNLLTNSQLNQLSSSHRTCLFRVTEEALTNVARHSKAKSVSIEFKKTTKSVTMTITDDGKSFDVNAAWKDHSGKRLGLLGMRERVEMIHGTFSISSTAGHGTTITAKIPIAAALPKRPAKIKKP